MQQLHSINCSISIWPIIKWVSFLIEMHLLEVRTTCVQQYVNDWF